MGNRIINLFTLAAVGVIIADLVAQPAGTKAVFDGVGSLWSTSVGGMLGKAPK